MIKFDEFYYGSFDGSQEQRGVIDISYNLTAGQQKGGTPSINVLLSGVSPLTLVNAKSLNYVKAFGKCEQRSVLPEGYTQLEYIESTGTQYIDINVSGNATFIGTAQSTTDSSTTSQVIVANSGASAGHWFGVQSPGAGSPYAKRWGLGATPTASSTIDGTTKIDFSITFMQTTQSGTVNDQTLTRESSAITHTDWIIFAGNTTPSYGFIGKVWGLKVVQNDVLVRNLIPAKNSSNIIGMYDLVSGQFFRNSGTGNFIEGGKATPSPDNVMPIWCNNGVLKYSRNKINVIADNVVVGKYISAQGVLSNSEFNFTYMLYVPVKPNTTYTLSFSSPVYFSSVSEYSSAEDAGFVIRQTKQSTSLNEPFDLTEFTFTTGATTNYVRFGLNMYRLQSLTIDDVLALNYMLAESATAVPYAPYVNDNGGIYADGTVETVAVSTFSQDDYLNAYCSIRSKITAHNSSRLYIVPCKPNTEYRFIFDNTDVSSPRCVINGFTDKPEIGMQADQGLYSSSNTYAGMHDATFTTDSDINYLAFWLYYNSASQPAVDKAILYETSLAATCQPLLSVGTYKDVQNITNGAITRNVAIKVLDGSEGWASYQSGVCWAASSLLKDKVSGNYISFSTHYGWTSSDISNMQNNRFLLHGSQRLCIKDDRFNTVTGFKQFLADQYAAGTPVIIVYPLATPTTSTVTAQTLNITQGTNIVTATGSVSDLELEVSYKAYAELTVEEIEAVNTDESVDVTIS